MGQEAPTSLADTGWRSHLDLVVDLTKAFIQETEGHTPSREAVLDRLQTRQLASPEGLALWAHLNQAAPDGLRGYAVKTQVGLQIRDRNAVSFLDFRSPSNITHEDEEGPGSSSSSSPGSGKSSPPLTITCAYSISRHEHTLHHPELPCIAVKAGALKSRHPGDPSKWYQSFPLEVCWYKCSSPYAHPGDPAWPEASISGVSVRAPTWLTDALGQRLASGCSPADSSPALGELAPGTSTTSSGGSSSSSLAAFAEAACVDRSRSAQGGEVWPVIRNGFNRFVTSLQPQQQEKEGMKQATKAVTDLIVATSKSKAWRMAGARPVGSFGRKTSLRNKHDLDLLVELNVDEHDTASFEASRKECLDDLAAARALCNPNKPGAKKAAKSGWRLLDRAPHWLHLTHPKLGVELDVQDRRAAFLAYMVQCRRAQLGLAAAPEAPTALCERLANADGSSTDSRQRAAFLTPLLTELEKGVDQRNHQQYGVSGTGHLFTTVVRALKAWCRFGFAAGQQQQQQQQQQPSASGSAVSSSSSSSGGGGAGVAADQARRSSKAHHPPGYALEVLVCHVLEQQLQAYDPADAQRRYGTQGTRELTLFLEVLQAASQLLRPAAPTPEEGSSSSSTAPAAIALSVFYSAEDCQLFRQCWEVPGRQCSPYIIHPADPSYNITAHCLFTGWAALAEAAGGLHAALVCALEGRGPAGQQGAVLTAGAASDSSGSGSSRDACQQVLGSTTLGAAVRAFAS